MNITREKIAQLYDRNLLDYKSYVELINMVSPVSWIKWLNKNLLFLGLGLIISGLVFLLAYNWFAIDKSIKLALSIALIAGAAVAASRNMENNFGAAMAFLTVFSIGIFCAVFGQIYQTGADNYELFLTWALLMLPLAAVVNKTSLWILFVLLINIAILLVPVKEAWYFPLANIAFFALALLPFQYAKQESYFYYFLGTWVTIYLMCKAFVSGYGDPMLYVFLIWCVAVSWFYAAKKNVYYLNICVLSFSIVFFWQIKQFVPLGSWFFYAVFALALSAGLGYLLVYVNKKIKGGANAN